MVAEALTVHASQGASHDMQGMEFKPAEQESAASSSSAWLSRQLIKLKSSSSRNGAARQPALEGDQETHSKSSWNRLGVPRICRRHQSDIEMGHQRQGLQPYARMVSS